MEQQREEDFQREREEQRYPFQRGIEEQRYQLRRALPQFQDQNDWTDENVQRIKDAITNGIIKSDSELRSHIGNESKKRNSDNNFTYGVIISENKYGESNAKTRANENEHAFYEEHAPILKSIGTKEDRNRFISFNKPTTEEQVAALKNSEDFFQKKIYDYMMGKILYESFRKDIGANSVSDDELLQQVDKIITLRHKENELFNLLRRTQNSRELRDKGHEFAEKKEKNNLEQLHTYFRWKDSYQELIKDAKNYKKYLKYKQKYIALKNRSGK